MGNKGAARSAQRRGSTAVACPMSCLDLRRL
jgi:hypothetical protein